MAPLGPVCDERVASRLSILLFFPSSSLWGSFIAGRLDISGLLSSGWFWIHKAAVLLPPQKCPVPPAGLVPPGSFCYLRASGATRASVSQILRSLSQGKSPSPEDPAMQPLRVSLALRLVTKISARGGGRMFPG